MMDYFGKPWPSDICDTGQQRPTPVGQECAHCAVPIEEEDRGTFMPCITREGAQLLPWHRECSMRSVVGSVAHLEGRCSCCGGVNEPGPQTPQELRTEALEVWHRITRGQWAS